MVQGEEPQLLRQRGWGMVVLKNRLPCAEERPWRTTLEDDLGECSAMSSNAGGIASTDGVAPRSRAAWQH